MNRPRPLFFILIAAFLLRIVLSGFGTLTLDQNTFIAWSNILVEKGFSRFYEGWSDYLPGYLYILWFLGKVKEVIPIPTVLLYKSPAIISDVLTGLLIYKIVEKIKDRRWGLITSSLYLFNPGVLANSTFWGQVDSLTSLFSLASIYFLSSNFVFSSILIAIGTLVKPQAAFVFPLLLLIMVRDKWKITKIIIYLVAGLSVFALSFLPFSNAKNIFPFIIERLGVTFNQYPYTSVNAFNFWGLLGFWKPDDRGRLLGLGIILTLMIPVATNLWRKKISRYFAASLVFAMTFLFMTRMHERHLFTTFAPLAVAVGTSNLGLLIPYLGFSGTYIANLYYSYVWISRDFTSVFSPVMTTFLSAINILLLGLMFFSFFKEKFLEKAVKLLGFLLPGKAETKIIDLPEERIEKKWAKGILFFILLFSLLTRVSWLSAPEKEYFDEVYHAFTARLVLHGDPKAWEWWNPHPEGFAYEWTHPPLAKLGMALGMQLFGENSFGWRIPGAILGVGSVFLVYLITKKLFDDETVALLAAGIFGLDGLALVMSRIGMNDIYLLFFVLLTIYLFMTKRFFVSALAFGLAISSKWSAIWAIPILFVLWLREKEKFKLSLFSFFVIPPIVYVAGYTQMFLTGHGLDIFIGVQKQMWWYHTQLEATHAYTSAWWSWPLMLRPIYLYTSDEINGFVSRIYAMGNPVVFWFGLASIVLVFIYTLIRKDKRLGFIIFSYLIFFIPWAASPRIMFLYHYLPSLPFAAIAGAFILRRFPGLRAPFFLLAYFAFVYFYPHWAGISVPLWLDTSYYWINSWR